MPQQRPEPLQRQHGVLNPLCSMGKLNKGILLFTFKYLFMYLFLLLRATRTARGRSQARGHIGATAAGLHHSHRNAGSLTRRARPRIESASAQLFARFVTAEPQRELPKEGM